MAGSLEGSNKDKVRLKARQGSYLSSSSTVSFIAFSMGSLLVTYCTKTRIGKKSDHQKHARKLDSYASYNPHEIYRVGFRQASRRVHLMNKQRNGTRS